MNALVSFSTYPTGIFRGGVKLVLFTVLPAGFIAYLPVEALRRLDVKLLGAVVGSAAVQNTTAPIPRGLAVPPARGRWSQEALL